MLVSIIITTYGRVDFLQEAIESAISQTYTNIEIIVVDDNADKKNIRSDVKKLVANYPHVRLVQNKENLGGSLSRNEGIKAAKGTLISFLDDDDYYAPDRIEKYVKAYQKHQDQKIGLLYSYVAAVNIKGKKIGEYRIDPKQNPLYQHMLECIAATSQWIVPRSVFDEVGMFEQTPCKQDSIMLLKILGAAYQPICIKEILGYYREHNHGRISGIGEKNIDGLTNFWKWSQKYYAQLSTREWKNVEIAFASQLLTFNVLLGKKVEARENLKIILKLRPVSKVSFKSIIKLCIGKSYNRLIRRKIYEKNNSDI